MDPIQRSIPLSALRGFRGIYGLKEDLFSGGFDDDWYLHLLQCIMPFLHDEVQVRDKKLPYLKPILGVQDTSS